MLDKRLELGGLQVGGPRTMQNVARFRKARNVYQTRDGYMVPRFHNAPAFTVNQANQVELTSTNQYKGKSFVVGKRAVASSQNFYHDGAQIIDTSLVGVPFALDPSPQGVTYPGGPQFVEKQGCIFIHWPIHGLFKYDGTQHYRAGSPLPWLFCAQYNIAGTTFVRVIQHKLDFAGNVVHSGYVQFPATPSGNNVIIQHDFAANDMIKPVFVGVTPTARNSSLGAGYDEIYYAGVGAGVLSNPARTVTITTAANDSKLVVGAYIMISATLTARLTNGLGTTAGAIALKVVSFTSTQVVLSLDNVKYINSQGTWAQGSMDVTTTLFTGATVGSNYWMSVWSSNVSTGNYVWKGQFPVQYLSTSSKTNTIDVSAPTVPAGGNDQTCFNYAGNMGDFYDVTTSKDVFTSDIYNNSLDYQEYPYSMTTYGDLLLVGLGNEILFSDTTLGGSFEMTEGLASIVVGEGDDGSVQSVCGNSDFFIVSRKYKNYYVSGNLATGNYRVQTVAETSVGAYSNESTLSVSEIVFLLNKQGLWAFKVGGGCDEVSINIQGLFDFASATHAFAEELEWDIDALPQYVDLTNFQGFGPASDPVATNSWMRMHFDVVRGLVLIMNPLQQILVLNMNNGEFYTWNNLAANYANFSDVKDIHPINGFYFLSINLTTYSAQLGKEFKTGVGRRNYGTCRLENTWYSGGEPSLEKQLNQMKLWGIVAIPLIFSHFVDWQTDNEIPDGVYTPASNVLFSHKHRLQGAKFQAVSVAIEFTPGDLEFQIEGMELELQGIQAGVKR